MNRGEATLDWDVNEFGPSFETGQNQEVVDAEFARLVEGLDLAVPAEVKEEVAATPGNKNYGSNDNKIREPW